MTDKPITHPGQQTVIPHLICDGAAQAIDFYKQAFGATELMRIPGKDGRLMHACIRIGNSHVYLYDEAPEWGALGPAALKGSPVVIHLNVNNVDDTLARATEAGAAIRMPAQDMFWGDRYGQLVDPFGHVWSVATHIRDMSAEEIQAAAAAVGC